MLIPNKNLLEWISQRDMENVLRSHDQLIVSSGSFREITIRSKEMADFVFAQIETLGFEKTQCFTNFPLDFSTEVEGESRVNFRNWDSSINFKERTEKELEITIPFSNSMAENFMEALAESGLETDPYGHVVVGEEVLNFPFLDDAFLKEIPVLRKVLGFPKRSEKV